MIEITKDTIIGDILDVAPQTAPSSGARSEGGAISICASSTDSVPLAGWRSSTMR